MIKKIYKFFGGPKIKFQINEFLKSNVIIYQNYLLRKTEFYKFFNDFKNNYEGYDKIDIKLTVLNTNEFAASNEFVEMQPVIRLMYEIPSDADQDAAMEWATKNEAERILLSEDDAEEMEKNLLWTTTLLPNASKILNGMSVGFLRW